MGGSVDSKHVAATLATAKLVERVGWAELAMQRARRLALEAHACRERAEVLRQELTARQRAAAELAAASTAQGVAG